MATETATWEAHSDDLHELTIDDGPLDAYLVRRDGDVWVIIPPGELEPWPLPFATVDAAKAVAEGRASRVSR